MANITLVHVVFNGSVSYVLVLCTCVTAYCIVDLSQHCFVLFAVAASDEAAFAGHPIRLLCGVVKSKTTDWMYQDHEHAGRQRISADVILSSYGSGRYTVDGSSLIINQVKASDAGIYTCGHGRQLYHKLQLNVSGL